MVIVLVKDLGFRFFKDFLKQILFNYLFLNNFANFV